MPTVNWGVSKRDVDAFDRDSQFKPYNGPLPPAGRVYNWRIKNLTFIPKTAENHPQIRIGLELVPRTADEAKYKTYFLMDYMSISDKTQWRYIPFLDALGVSTQDFLSRTKTKEDGTIIRIGAYRQDGTYMIGAQLKTRDDDNYPRQIGTYTDAYVPDDEDLSDEDVEDDEEYDEELDPDEYEDEDEEEDDGEEEYEDEEEFEDEEEEEQEEEPEPARTRRKQPAGRKRTSRPTANGRTTRGRRR